MNNQKDSPILTTTAGAPVADNQNSITAGPRGPLLMQDFQLLEKLAHQNRERVPERENHLPSARSVGYLPQHFPSAFSAEFAVFRLLIRSARYRQVLRSVRSADEPLATRVSRTHPGSAIRNPCRSAGGKYTPVADILRCDMARRLPTF